MDKIKHDIVYKKVKVAMPHCSVCGEQLDGNGSKLLPYRCSCGVWMQDWGTGIWMILPTTEGSKHE